MFSLNGMRHFEGKPNTKTVRAWSKADNIISFRTECYTKAIVFSQTGTNLAVPLGSTARYEALLSNAVSQASY